MSNRTVVVYVGPTVSSDDVLGTLPSAKLRPPAARGDLYAEQWKPGDAAVIVDGYYRDRPSVGHKEILWLLRQGVEVIGTASMGALRAAELSPFGMRGGGDVFRMYIDGSIDGDDEVAILHGPASVGYPSHTVALVNLRHGCEKGVAAGLFPAETASVICNAAAELPFTHRTWDDIAKAAGPEARDTLEVLRHRIMTRQWDLKHSDALSTLREIDVDAKVPTLDWAAHDALSAITPVELLKWRSSRASVLDQKMSDLDVLNAARLFDDSYPKLHEDVLVGLLADFAAEHGISVAEYAAGRLGTDIAAPAELPPTLAQWLTHDERNHLDVVDQATTVMVRVWPVWKSADWRSAILDRLRESERWDSWSAIVADADRVADETRHRIVIPPPLIRAKLFLRHWQRSGSSPNIELSRRGFASMEDLGRAVTRFFAYDMRRKQKK